MEDTTARIRAGDRAEWNALIGPYLPRLKRFAERHLPTEARGMIAAEDLVQEAVIKGIRQLHRFEFRREHAFLAYLLTAIRHRIVDEVRRVHRQPAFVSIVEREHVDPAASPLERIVARENARRYAEALARLDDRDRQLIVLRVERQLPYLDLAARLGISTDAVRMAVKRALWRLAKRLKQSSTN